MVQDHMPDTVLEVLGKVILYMNIFLNYLALKFYAFNSSACPLRTPFCS